MSRNADLVESLAFGRHRLVAAFITGRVEDEPTRGGRLVVVGLLVAGLLVAGAAITALVAPRAAIDWQGPGLVVDEDSGALYLIADDEAGSEGPVLRPVANATSARLLAGDAAPQSVPGPVVDRSPQGPPVGLASAPAVVPGPDRLLVSGWTACTGTGRGIRVALAPEPAVQSVVPDTGLVVDVDGQRWLLATTRSHDGRVVAHRHRVRAGSAHAGATAPTVTPEWVDLFPVGEPAATVDVHAPAPTAGAPVCAVLDHAPDGRPSVRLGVAPRDAASPRDVPAGRTAVHLAPAHAALARGGDRTAYLLTQEGRRHRVTDDALGRLGLGDVEPTRVPAAWLALVERGVVLSAEAARCPSGESVSRCR